MNDLLARRRCCYPHNTPQTQQTNIHALSRIRSRAPSNQSAAYICLRPQVHRDRLCYVCFDNIIRNAVSLWRRRWRAADIFIALICGLGCDMGQCLLVFGGPIELYTLTAEHHNPNTQSCVKVKSTEHKLFVLISRIGSLCLVDRKGEVTVNPKHPTRRERANIVFRDRAHRCY